MIDKTCYYCKPVGKKECDACTNVTKSNFVGNADWLYIEQLEKEVADLKEKVKIPKFAIIGNNGIECLDPICEHCANIDKRQLEKENEELKRKIQSYKYEREKLHGYLAKEEVNLVQKTFKIGDSITPEDWERGRTVNGKIYHFKLTNGQKVICKKTVYKCLSEPEIEFFEITEIEDEVKE